MRTSRLLCALALFTSLAAQAKPAATLEKEPDQWKGKAYEHPAQVSVMAGLGMLGNVVGFGANASLAFKIIHLGFIDDINDQVYLEMTGGGIFAPGGVGGTYGLHLRWDFHKNDLWTFYSIGGFGGGFSGPALGNVRAFYPRVGIGALWNLFEFMSFRAEYSHEFTGVGVVWLL